MGIQTLKYLIAHPEVYAHMEDKAIYLENELNAFIKSNNLPLTFIRFKGMTCLFFKAGDFSSYDDVKDCDTEKYAEFFRKMLDRGILLPPAQFEGWFLSEAHTMQDLENLISKTKEVLLSMYTH